MDYYHAIKKLVYDEKKLTISEFKEALAKNYGRGYTPEAAKDATAEVVAELGRKGKSVSEKQIEDIFKMFLNGVATKEEKAKYDKLLEMIDAIPK